MLCCKDLLPGMFWMLLSAFGLWEVVVVFYPSRCSSSRAHTVSGKSSGQVWIGAAAVAPAGLKCCLNKTLISSYLGKLFRTNMPHALHAASFELWTKIQFPISGNCELWSGPETRVPWLWQLQLITQNHRSNRFWFMLAKGHRIVANSA